MKTHVDDHPAIEQVKTSLEEMPPLKTFGLADAIRLGAEHTEQAYSWREGDKVCALSAAIITTKAMGGE